MKLDNNKFQRQLEFNKKWKGSKASGCLEAVTAFGKSFCGILAIKDLQDHPQYTTIIVVPSTFLLDQWNDHIKKHELKNCSVMTIQSIIRLKVLPSCSLVICDEQHEFFGKEYSKVFDIPRFWYMGLSGTLTDEMKVELAKRGVPVVDTVTIEEAQQNNWISEFNVYNLAIPISYTEQKYLDELDETYHSNMTIFENYPETHKMFKVTAKRQVMDKEGNKREVNIYGLAEKKANEIGLSLGEVLGKARTVQKTVAERQKFFYNHPDKLDMVREILDYLPDQLAITFSLSVDMINKLESHDSVTYHSKMKAKEKKASIEKFMTLGNKCRCIHSGLSLVRGADFPNLSLGIRVSYNSSKIQWGQARGRQLRKEGNKLSTIINLYMKRTDNKWSTEERWLRRALENSELNVKWITSLNEIK